MRAAGRLSRKFAEKLQESGRNGISAETELEFRSGCAWLQFERKTFPFFTTKFGLPRTLMSPIPPRLPSSPVATFLTRGCVSQSLRHESNRHWAPMRSRPKSLAAAFEFSVGGNCTRLEGLISGQSWQPLFQIASKIRGNLERRHLHESCL